MLIQWKGAHAVTQLSLNDLENRYLLVTKLRSESSAIVSEGNLEAFNTLIAEARAGGHANEQATALVYDFVYVSIVEVLAAKFIKQFYVITHPFTGNTCNLLGNRGLFTEEKNISSCCTCTCWLNSCCFEKD